MEKTELENIVPAKKLYSAIKRNSPKVHQKILNINTYNFLFLVNFSAFLHFLGKIDYNQILEFNGGSLIMTITFIMIALLLLLVILLKITAFLGWIVKDLVKYFNFFNTFALISVGSRKNIVGVGSSSEIQRNVFTLTQKDGYFFDEKINSFPGEYIKFMLIRKKKKIIIILVKEYGIHTKNYIIEVINGFDVKIKHDSRYSLLLHKLNSEGIRLEVYGNANAHKKFQRQCRSNI